MDHKEFLQEKLAEILNGEQSTVITEAQHVIADYCMMEGYYDNDGDLDEGFEILFNLAETFDDSQLEALKEALFEMSCISEEYADSLMESKDDSDDEDDMEDDDSDDEENMEDDDEIDEKKFRVLTKQKRKLKKKAKAAGKLGKEKTSSVRFRAKYQFNPKKNRFVKRKQARSAIKQKKMDRKFTKRMKRRRH